MQTPRALTAEPLRSERLDLEPLGIDHAPEAARVFDDQRLHVHIGGFPATEEQLRSRYARQVTGRSPDGTEVWLNWMLRLRSTGELVGAVQATVRRSMASSGNGGPVAVLAWVVATPQQRHGYAREAATAMCDWLRRRGVQRFAAHIQQGHLASIGVARALGMTATDTVVDGEIRWTTDGSADELIQPL